MRQRHEPFYVREGQRLKEDAVDDGEDCDRRAEADRERQHFQRRARDLDSRTVPALGRASQYRDAAGSG